MRKSRCAGVFLVFFQALAGVRLARWGEEPDVGVLGVELCGGDGGEVDLLRLVLEVVLVDRVGGGGNVERVLSSQEPVKTDSCKTLEGEAHAPEW